MKEVKYAAGKLWSDVNTVVKNANGNVNVGIAWFAGDPVGRQRRRRRHVRRTRATSRSTAGTRCTARSPRTTPAMPRWRFTLSGTSWFPSAAWVSLGANGATSAVHVVGGRPAARGRIHRLRRRRRQWNRPLGRLPRRDGRRGRQPLDGRQVHPERAADPVRELGHADHDGLAVGPVPSATTGEPGPTARLLRDSRRILIS